MVYEKLCKSYESVKAEIPFVPKVAIVLGSGLGAYAESLQVVKELDYKQIEDFPFSTVEGHEGCYIFAYLDEIPVVCMKGRVHYYEGYPMSDVVLPIRLMKMMGAEILFLSNAAGGVNTSFQAGDLMMITDHICQVPNPLMGSNLDALGERFPDMSETYDRDLQEIIKSVAKVQGVDLKEGVYIQLTGPSYETPAEVNMCRRLGADAVGMSTACEAIAANHMKMKICGISCITNMAAGVSLVPLSHKEVKETADKTAKTFEALVSESIRRMVSE